MEAETQKILVVGGAGYIGSHVVKTLRDAGKCPVVFDNMRVDCRKICCMEFLSSKATRSFQNN